MVNKNLPFAPVALTLAMSMAATATSMAATDQVADALFEGAEISLDTRFALVHREFRDTPDSNREQAALGMILKYQSGKIADFLQLGVAGYHVEKFSASGSVANDVLPLRADGSQDNRIGKLGELYAVFAKDNWSATVGRQKVKAMLVSSSTQRAIPNTYQGVNFRYTIAGVTLSSQWYNRWSRRHDDNWEQFTTDLGTQIDYLWINSLVYKTGDLSLELERSESKDFLIKWGLRAGYEWQLSESQRLAARAGYFTSEDAGNLFVVGAEAGELDDEDGAATGTRSQNDGSGAFAQITWSVDNWAFSLAASQFDETWIEDNFSGDHGTNPFPTRSIVFPDFSNTNERAMLGSVQYNWQRWVPGLTTTFAYVEGRGIENSVDKSLGTAEERYREWFIVYRPQWLQGLSVQWRHHQYESKKLGNVDGVKGDDTDDRIFIDYTYKF